MLEVFRFRGAVFVSFYLLCRVFCYNSFYTQTTSRVVTGTMVYSGMVCPGLLWYSTVYTGLACPGLVRCGTVQYVCPELVQCTIMASPMKVCGPEPEYTEPAQ